jgi:hypothetical protein
MAKEKLTLTQLKVESCITSLSGDQLDSIKGGIATVTVQGRRNHYTIRWTAVDTRAQADYASAQSVPFTGKG